MQAARLDTFCMLWGILIVLCYLAARKVSKLQGVLERCWDNYCCLMWGYAGAVLDTLACYGGF